MDDGVDRLYALPFDEFTAARNALAKERKDAALKELPKPTRTAWALNQLARERPDDIASLLLAGARLREAQRAALEGDSSDLRDANRALHEQVSRLADLTDVSAPLRDRLTSTLQAAATSRRAGDVLQAGRLTEDLEPSGFGFDEDTVPADWSPPLPTPDQRPSPSGERSEPPPASAGARAAPAAGNKERRRLEEEFRVLAEEAAEAEARAVEARRKANEAEKRLQSVSESPEISERS